jgi:hypothetical protein
MRVKLGGKRRQSVIACPFADAADLLADAAVLMMLCVMLAFVATQPTRFDASLEGSAGDLCDELRLPAEDASGRDADVTAVVTQRDAPDHRLDIGLAKVGVSTGRAALGAVEARVDAGHQRVECNAKRARMRLEDLLSVGHDPSLL